MSPLTLPSLHIYPLGRPSCHASSFSLLLFVWGHPSLWDFLSDGLLQSWPMPTSNLASRHFRSSFSLGKASMSKAILFIISSIFVNLLLSILLLTCSCISVTSWRRILWECIVASILRILYQGFHRWRQTVDAIFSMIVARSTDLQQKIKT